MLYSEFTKTLSQCGEDKLFFVKYECDEKLRRVLNHDGNPVDTVKEVLKLANEMDKDLEVKFYSRALDVCAYASEIITNENSLVLCYSKIIKE